MLTIYISGPISSDLDFKKHFEEAEHEIKERYGIGVRVINPARLCEVLRDLTYEEYMRIDYELIKMSDFICMIGDWRNSKGANAEAIFAKSIGKKVIELNGWKII